MTTSNASTGKRTKARTYELLLVMETLAVLIIMWSMLPLYRAIAASAGHQIGVLPESPIPLVAALILFHCVYWFRLLRVPVSMVRHSLVASHIILFLGRLSFIFGTSFFALIVYRHLPQLVVWNATLLAMRLVASFFILFSLYCYSTELERLGLALRPPPH
jgi:hypothetical protein